jgi:hypothetical protein
VTRPLQGRSRRLTIRTLFAVLVTGLLAGCASSPPSASPTSSAVGAASPTSTVASTTAAPSPTPVRHANAVLGYAVTLPPAWRVSECLSRISQDPAFVGHDVLTWRTVADEQDLGVSGGTGPTGAFAWIVMIEAQVTPQTVMEFVAARAGGSAGAVESATIDGRAAARTFDSAGNSTGYHLAGSGRMYSITITPGSESRPPQLTNATFDAIARSVTLVAPAARPTPTPAPVVTPVVEALADAVAAAFAASDADRVRDLITPRCWFNAGYWQSEGTASSRDKFTAGLRTAFSQGLKVTVEPRPIRTAPLTGGAFWVWSTWSAYGTPPRSSPQSNVQLAFDQVDGRWYLVGALFNAER